MLASSRWMVPLVPTSFSLVNVNIDKTSLSKCQEFLILTMILPDSGLSSHEISNSLRLLMTRFRKLMLIPSLPSLPLYLYPSPPLLPSSCLRLSPGHHLSGPAAVELYTLLCSLFSLWFILTFLSTSRTKTNIIKPRWNFQSILHADFAEWLCLSN